MYRFHTDHLWRCRNKQLMKRLCGGVLYIAASSMPGRLVAAAKGRRSPQAMDVPSQRSLWREPWTSTSGSWRRSWAALLEKVGCMGLPSAAKRSPTGHVAMSISLDLSVGQVRVIESLPPLRLTLRDSCRMFRADHRKDVIPANSQLRRP